MSAKQITRLMLMPINVMLIMFGCFLNCSKSLPAINNVEPSTIKADSLFSSADSIVVAWKPPELIDVNSPINKFILYFRIHNKNESEWKTIDSADGQLVNPELVIYHDSLGDGIYDFAVRCFDLNDDGSEIHTSLDSTATPITGWFLCWVKDTLN